jgi:heme exporter protein B
MNTKARDIMLPILMLPVLVPIVIAGVKSTALVLEAQPLAESVLWIQIMVIFDVIYLIAASLIFESAIEQ